MLGVDDLTERVQVGAPVGVHHALGRAGRAGGVVDRYRRELVLDGQASGSSGPAASRSAYSRPASEASPERWGERPKAFVVRKSDQTLGEQELIEYVRQRIARYKTPDHIEFVQELPKTSTDKVQKRAARA